MAKYFCRTCRYRFVTKGDKVPKNCPSCGRPDVREDYNAQDLLKEVDSGDY